MEIPSESDFAQHHAMQEAKDLQCQKIQGIRSELSLGQFLAQPLSMVRPRVDAPRLLINTQVIGLECPSGILE